MRECGNDGMMDTIANQIVAFLALGIAPILHCIFPRVRDIRSGLLSLFQPSIIPLFHGMTLNTLFKRCLPPVCATAAIVMAGCVGPAEHRLKADRAARDIVSEKYRDTLGRDETVAIERPGDLLRNRLLLEQDLPVSSGASLGSRHLEPIPHWPEPTPDLTPDADETPLPAGPLTLTLLDALQIGALNSASYQNRKEDVFRNALALDLERNAFRGIFLGQLRGLGRYDASGDEAQGGTVVSGESGAKKTLAGGTEIAAELAVDLANLLTGGGASSLGLAVDTSISIPLMRGAGRHIAAESLTQAERTVVYAILDFEHYKKQFAVEIASRYYSVLRRMDEVGNSRENYQSALASAQRSRRLADAGRVKEIEVDQAVQNELRARQRWIAADETRRRALDAFKTLIGLPPDAHIDLAPDDRIRATLPDLPETDLGKEASQKRDETANSATDNAWAEREKTAVREALDHRLDLKQQIGKVYDAQRAVVVAADRLRAELTLLGSAPLGSRRASVDNATQDAARLRPDKGIITGLLTLNLPIERTAERVAYRNRLIDLERAVRAVQAMEDDIKLSVRNALRDMKLARENLRIQTVAVGLAEKRVRSVSLFLEAGRAQMRDLIEAQDALLAARNGLTSAIVDYRIAEMELLRDTGTLLVDKQGLPSLLSPDNSSLEEPHHDHASPHEE